MSFEDVGQIQLDSWWVGEAVALLMIIYVDRDVAKKIVSEVTTVLRWVGNPPPYE